MKKQYFIDGKPYTALGAHRALWRSLELHPEWTKSDFFTTHECNPMPMRICYACDLCHSLCEICPLEFECEGFDSTYYKWVFAKSHDERVRYANLMANMKWSEKTVWRRYYLDSKNKKCSLDCGAYEHIRELCEEYEWSYEDSDGISRETFMEVISYDEI